MQQVANIQSVYLCTTDQMMLLLCICSYLQFPDVEVEPHAVLQPDPVGDMASFDVQ